MVHAAPRDRLRGRGREEEDTSQRGMTGNGDNTPMERYHCKPGWGPK